jgi:hypothetical protein
MDISVRSFRRALRIEHLRFRINSYSQQLHSIQAQRDNDLQVERVLQREMALAKSELNLLKMRSSAVPTAAVGEPR